MSLSEAVILSTDTPIRAQHAVGDADIEPLRLRDGSTKHFPQRSRSDTVRVHQHLGVLPRLPYFGTAVVADAVAPSLYPACTKRFGPLVYSLYAARRHPRLPLAAIDSKRRECRARHNAYSIMKCRGR